MKKLVILLFTAVACWAQLDKIAFITLEESAHAMTLKEARVIDGTLEERAVEQYGTYELLVLDDGGESLYKSRFNSQLHHSIGPEDSRSGKAEVITLDNAIKVLRFPWDDRMATALISDESGLKLTIDLTSVAHGVATRDGRATIKLVQGDGSENRVNFVVLSEGYTQSELNSGKFDRDLARGIQEVFACVPYKQYKGHFNVYAISAASQKSGIGGYFGSTQSSSTPRLIHLSGTGTQKVSSTLQQLKPDYDKVLVLINTTTYGGAGADFATATINAQCGDLILHEAAHGYAKLADEYDYYYSIPASEQANCTKETQRDRVKWNVWIDQSTPVPTPKTGSFTSVAGLFEGCMYKTTGWYRPRYSCKMRTLASGFCEVCRETLIARAYRDITPIESVSPKEGTLSTENTSQLTVETVQTTDNSVTVYWYCNGTKVEGLKGSTVDMTELPLVKGMNDVRAIAVDENSMVRIGYNLPLLRDTADWRVDHTGVPVVSQKVEKQQILTTLAGSDLHYELPFEGEYTIQLFSVSGRLLFSKKVTKRTGQIHLSEINMGSGTIFVNFKGETIDYTTQKISL